MQIALPRPGRWRPLGLALVLAALVTLSGCSGTGLTDSGMGSPSPAGATPTAAPQATDTPTSSPTATGTPTATTTATATARPTPVDRNVTGQLTVVVGTEEVTAAVESVEGRFSFDGTAPHTWHAASGVTLAEALSTLGVEATAETVTYDGTTYDGREPTTTVAIRANGDPVDPTTYTLADGDEIWVTVEPAGTNRSTPGAYIEEDDQHIHGHLEVEVDGRALNFSRERYQSNDRYFHFEHEDGRSWHAHSYAVTLEYALDSLDGLTVSADGETLTYDGTTYNDSRPDETVRIEVNGAPVTPGDYYLKDWDGVQVVVEGGS